MTDESSEAEIIELRPGQDAQDDDRPVATGPRPTTYCSHTRVRLDSEARRVYCRHCDREVPAFDALKRMAQNRERLILERKEAERRTKVTKANLEELLRDERNAKARRRSWAKHEPEAMRHLRAVMGLLVGYGQPLGWSAIEDAQRFVAGEDEPTETGVVG